MALSINSNIASLGAQRRFGITSQKLQQTYERLSSGLRINRPSDDAAGLALADSLRADSRVAAVAIRNANDGISLTAIADSALQEIGSILTRMAELAEQSANGVYTEVQRSALSQEFVSLGSEIQRIAQTTSFNGISLLSNTGTITLQVGFDSTQNSQISINGVEGTLDSLGLAGAGSSVLSFSLVAGSSEASQAASLAALDAINSAIENLSASRGVLGAAESRLNIAINHLSLTRENLVAAESRIRDADIAQEAAELVRLQVLQQAGTAVLAQANQQPNLVLKLLSQQ